MQTITLCHFLNVSDVTSHVYCFELNYFIFVLDLQNLRVGKKVKAVLETRDHKDNPLERGGECVTAEVQHRIAGVSRSVVVNVLDQRDGTYGISFIPDVPGKLALHIKVNEEHIQVSFISVA